MTSFYQLWRTEGKPPVQALAEAQRELREEEGVSASILLGGILYDGSMIRIRGRALQAKKLNTILLSSAFPAGDDKVQIRKGTTVKRMLKLTAYVSGKVQNVGYRSKVVTIARVFGLKGYVKNLPDGRVKIFAEGHKADLERFLEAVRINNTLIDVAEIEAEFSEANGSYEEFFQIEEEIDTDASLDRVLEYLRELIFVVKEGFRDYGLKLDSMSSSLNEISGKQDDLKEAITEGFRETGSSLNEISGKQDQIIDRIDGAREEIVSEVCGMRSDLKGRTEERLQRIESDVTEIKARMRS